MNRCSSCGYINYDTDTLCRKCGMSLKAENKKTAPKGIKFERNTTPIGKKSGIKLEGPGSAHTDLGESAYYTSERNTAHESVKMPAKGGIKLTPHQPAAEDARVQHDVTASKYAAQPAVKRKKPWFLIPVAVAAAAVLLLARPGGRHEPLPDSTASAGDVYLSADGFTKGEDAAQHKTSANNAAQEEKGKVSHVETDVTDQQKPPAPTPTVKPDNSNREDALNTYKYMILVNDYDGGCLQFPDHGWCIYPAEYFYLCDMDSDGIEELIVYTVTDFNALGFKIFTYKNGEPKLIADHISSCDISEWTNARLTLEVYDGKYVSVCAYAATIGTIGASSLNLISYDGRSAKVEHRERPDSYSSCIDLLNSNAGIPAEEAMDYFDGLSDLNAARKLSSDRAKAYSAYKNAVVRNESDGAYLRFPDWGDELFPVEYFYLCDMDSDGVEELIVYTMTDFNALGFKIFTCKNGKLKLLTDHTSACDIPVWSNARMTFDVYDDKYISVCAHGPEMIGGDGSFYLISYDGASVKVESKEYPDGYIDRVDLMYDNGGIPARDAADYFDLLLSWVQA